MVNIGVLVSGGGTNLQALIDAISNNTIKNGRIVTVVSNKSDAYALERAKLNDIDIKVILKKDYSDYKSFNLAIKSYLKKCNVDLIVLAGFLAIIDENLIDEYENRIINIHPSLIPSFCGNGYYG